MNEKTWDPLGHKHCEAIEEPSAGQPPRSPTGIGKAFLARSAHAPLMMTGLGENVLYCALCAALAIAAALGVLSTLGA